MRVTSSQNVLKRIYLNSIQFIDSLFFSFGRSLAALISNITIPRMSFSAVKLYPPFFLSHPLLNFVFFEDGVVGAVGVVGVLIPEPVPADAGTTNVLLPVADDDPLEDSVDCADARRVGNTRENLPFGFGDGVGWGTSSKVDC